MKLNYEQAVRKLASCGQEHVLSQWKKLSAKARADLLSQIDAIDPKSIARCRAALKEGSAAIDNSNGAAPVVSVLKGAALAKATAAGEGELRAGRVAALLVAGGQGSRLGYEGPKGCYPIGPVTNAPLFYFHARKILARSVRYGKPIPFYIMTSEANNAATVECFRQNDYFGLDEKNVFFFTQGMWPGMTPEGKVVMDGPGHVFMSPDGHGGLLSALKRSGALADMRRRGIKSVCFFQVDNPLVDVAAPAFVGFHVLQGSEYTLKLCAKRDPLEKVGMPMRFGKTFRMVEYTEMTDEQCRRKAKDGGLYFRYGSPAMHVFDRAFLEREASKPMPIHLAFKKIPMFDGKKVVKPDSPNGYKFEKFVFDILPNAKKAAFVAFDREEEFSPVKNAAGENSPATCKAALQAKWRRLLASAGVEVGEGVTLEIDPAHVLDAEDVRKRGLAI